MAKEKISLITEEDSRKGKIQHQIKAGLMTNEIYETLSPTEQAQVRATLFEMHANPVEAPVALSGLEFIVFGLAKLLFKKHEGQLTVQEQEFYDRFKEMVMKHEITMNASDWYVPYAEDAMLKAKQNREDYKRKKVDITGSFT